METLAAILDATKRGWHVTFATGERGSLVVTGTIIKDGKKYIGQMVLAPGHVVEDDGFIAHVTRLTTDDRRLPPTEAEQLATAIAERKRRDPDAPDVIVGPLYMLDREYGLYGGGS